MNPHGFEHMLVTGLIAAFALASIGLVALVTVRLLAQLTGAL